MEIYSFSVAWIDVLPKDHAASSNEERYSFVTSDADSDGMQERYTRGG